jgi:hypothetical protein
MGVEIYLVDDAKQEKFELGKTRTGFLESVLDYLQLEGVTQSEQLDPSFTFKLVCDNCLYYCLIHNSLDYGSWDTSNNIEEHKTQMKRITDRIINWAKGRTLRMILDADWGKGLVQDYR